nr:ATP-binding protein [Nocardioides convexus]
MFELVKNAYDADASIVTVTMARLDKPDAWIRVEDDGLGMSYETIRDIWLVPGHDHKAKNRKAGKRSPKGRLPLGEKGVGRFAVHKARRRRRGRIARAWRRRSRPVGRLGGGRSF